MCTANGQILQTDPCEKGLKKAGIKTEKTTKNKEKYVFISFSYFFMGFSQVFERFSVDFCKGRMSKNTLQISLKSSQILPLRISSVLTPVRRIRDLCEISENEVCFDFRFRTQELSILGLKHEF